MCCRCCSVRQQKIWVFTIGSLLAAIGITLITAWPTISSKIIDSALPLSPSSYTYSKWHTTPIDLHMTFYLYNWTNSHEASNPAVKPHFEELGPYSFSEVKIKEDITWHNNNSTVTYYGRRTWHWDAAASNGSLDDIIIVPNFPSVTGSKFVRKMHKVFRKIVNFALNREGGGLILKHTAIEWLFDGFYDDMFDFAVRLHSPMLPIYSNEFAWFYNRNGSKEAEGTYTVHTGKGDLSQLGDLKFWKDATHTGYWEGECGKINGSTGDIWAPGKSFDDTVSIFISDASRFVNLFPQQKISSRGVDSWLYTSTDQTFDSGYIAPDTKCFCVKGRQCPRNGVIDFSPVTFRAPVYLSHPHFYRADADYYLANTTGMKPDAEKHGIYAIIEPTLGVPLEVHGQVLISVLVEQDEYMDYFKDLAHDFYAPLFVIQLKAEISPEILSFLKFALLVPKLGQYIGVALLVIGVIMLAVGVWLTRAHKWRGDVEPDSDKKELVNANKD